MTHSANLTFNAGSSSLKIGVFDALTLEEITRHDAKNLDAALALIKETGVSVQRVAHRVVHGGEHFSAPVVLDDAIINELRTLIPLAPLHLPPSLEMIGQLRTLYPDIPHVACFDTGFHTTLPPLERALPLPPSFTSGGMRRYGFHGLSYQYIASVLPDAAGETALGRVVVAHLGSGASLCAMHRLQSVATTMSFSSLDGLMMGTRCGTIDPGVILYLLRERRMDADKVSDLLYHHAGLKGLAGESDMRTLEAAGTPEADFAIALFCYQVAKHVASMATALQGIDALVFTGGIGEHSARVRREVCARLEWIGVTLDAAADGKRSACISTPSSKVKAYVIATNEEKMMAELSRAL